MQGLVFREFLTVVQEQWSLDMVDEIIAKANVPSDGAYTSGGYYPHSEIIAMVHALSEQTGMAVTDLVRFFGQKLFHRFAKLSHIYFLMMTIFLPLLVA